MDPTVQFWVSTGIQVLGLAGVVIGLFFTTRQIRLASEVARETLDWNRKTYTEDKLEKKPDPEKVIRLERAFAIQDSIETIPLSVILEEINKDPALRLDIRHMLSRFERIARGIRVGVLDEAIIAASLGVHMAKVFLNFRDYIGHLQSSTPTGGLEEYTDLMERWMRFRKPMFEMIYLRGPTNENDEQVAAGQPATPPRVGG